MDGLRVAAANSLESELYFSVRLLRLGRTCLCLVLTDCQSCSFTSHAAGMRLLRPWVASPFLEGLNMTRIPEFSSTPLPLRSYKFNHRVAGWKGWKIREEWEDEERIKSKAVNHRRWEGEEDPTEKGSGVFWETVRPNETVQSGHATVIEKHFCHWN